MSTNDTNKSQKEPMPIASEVAEELDLDATMTVAQAIEMSVTESRIVTMRGGADEAADLFFESDDSVDASTGVTEYWGTDDDGCDWRVHLHVDGVPL